MRYLAILLMLAATPLLRAAEPDKPKLVVLVVFDQMRGDYIERWMPLYGKDGFRRLTGEGAWYDNCHYPYAITTTGPGHASMLSGTTPERHGIINNGWFDRATRTTVNCATSNRYDRVPADTNRFPPEKEAEEKATDEDLKARGNPDRMLSPTVADVLKETTGGRGKVFGLSFKDRSAVMPTGKKGDGVYWLDSTDGMIVTSTYYRTTPHPWIAKLNSTHFADRWFDKPWNRLRADVDYVKHSGPDDVRGESVGVKQGRVFPHPMNGGKPALSKAYYDALFNSPFGNDFLLEVVKTCIVEEKLGQDETPDLLAVSFSSNDAVGHAYGPDSQEVMDTTLRSDLIVAELLKFLDDKVGQGNYLVALTADHGICPLPEVAAGQGKDAQRIAAKDMLGEIEAHLTAKYAAIPPRTRWLESVVAPWIYLNQKVISDKGLKPEIVEKAVVEYLTGRPGVQRPITRSELLSSKFADDQVGRMVQRSFHPDRAGDVAFLMKPLYLLTSQTTGTTHGAPYEYDTHVPLVFFGWKTESGVRKEKATPQSIASVFAKALGIPKPRDAEFDVPTPVWK